MEVGRWFVAAVAILMLLPAVAMAQENAVEADAAPSTDFEQTVAFDNLKVLALDGTAGEVDIKSVEFTVANKKSGGFMGIGGSDTDFEAVITTRLACATTDTSKWKLGIMVEFLDQGGNVIDRVTNSDSIKNNEKKIDFKHTTLKWALSHIKEARVTVVAKQ
jgi:hypothetical protein